MKKSLLVAAILCFALAMGSPVSADDAAGRQELIDAVDHGVKVIESKGKAGLEELKNYRFAGGNYLYVTDMNAVVIMHPVAPELLNKDCTAIRATDGKYFGAEMKSKAEKNGSGWTSYMWPNHLKNKTPELKCTYFKTANMAGTKVIVYAAMFGISEAGCK
ncbi:MAG TPA: cache domain-containing protein [Deltaproteobacteria bacterium]|nr:cache domain-containing protein [Deltaproteobacteria bacterium]HQI80160.1 cache domain-containing protein [Deltaproteobacteria bacterium]